MQYVNFMYARMHTQTKFSIEYTNVVLAHARSINVERCVHDAIKDADSSSSLHTDPSPHLNFRWMLGSACKWKLRINSAHTHTHTATLKIIVM